jgi:Effector-associated domain 1
MTGPEMVQFGEALNGAFNYADLEMLLRGMNRQITNFVSANATFRAQIAELVAAANREGWIAQFVETAVGARRNNAGIQSFLAANPDWDPAKHPPNAHPCDTLFVYGGKCFIARELLREYLKKMGRATSEKVLVVTSNHRKVGKTFSKELVVYLSNNSQPSGVAWIDLDQCDFDLVTLAEALSRQLGVPDAPMPPQDLEQPARWLKDLVAWLIPVGADQATPKVWWIVLDGFREKVPSEAIHAFIAELAKQIQGTERFRLIVVDYTNPFSLEIGAFVLKDKVEPLGREDVKRFLQEIHRQTHHLEPSESELTDYVDGCYHKLAEYVLKHPEFADNQLLLNMAVRDAVTVIRGEV